LPSPAEEKAWTLTATVPARFSGGRQYFSAVPEQDAEVLEVLIGKMGKDRDVDAVLRECAWRTRASPSLVSQSAISPRPLNFGLVDPLDGRFYLIDHAARNRPKRSAAGVTRRAPPEEPQAGASP
jgi:hypothetical protein